MFIKFEKAEVKDIKLIQNLAKLSWDDAYKNILSKEQIDYMLKLMYSEKEIGKQLKENKNYHYQLIYFEHKTVGFLGYEHHYEKNTTKLHRLYLSPTAKGKGIGKASLEFLKSEVTLAQDYRIILNVNKNNIALEIYKKYGFSIYDEGVFDIGNTYVMDDYLMEYIL